MPMCEAEWNGLHAEICYDAEDGKPDVIGVQLFLELRQNGLPVLKRLPDAVQEYIREGGALYEWAHKQAQMDVAWRQEEGKKI